MVFLIVVVVLFLFKLKCNNRVKDRICVIGLVMFLFVIFGVELFVGLYKLKFCLFRLVEGSMFIELVIMVYLFDKMLLNKLEYSKMLNWDGFLINCMVVLLIYIWDNVIFG